MRSNDKAAGRVDMGEASRIYTDEFLSLSEIGARFGVSRQRILQLFVAHGIDRRPRGFRYEQATGRSSYFLNRSLLKRLHAGMGLAPARIAELLGVDEQTVLRHLKAYRIPQGSQHLSYRVVPAKIKILIDLQRAAIEQSQG